jgi:vitamin K-dependent gamma-carboxylase
MRAQKSLVAKVVDSAFAPVDIASLVFFRIAFGLLMVWDVCQHFSRHWIAAYWLQPRFLFKYYGFSWVQPWPDNWLYLHWAALGLFALFIAAGFVYRASAALFFLSYAYFFLLDEATYVNHTYLICLFGFLLIFVPANRAFSVDAWLNPKIRSETTPAWTLWLLRAQIGAVYFYGGIAKIAPDWLRGEPLRMRMARHTDFPIIGRFFGEEWAVYAVSYGGMLLDLLIVPLLLWRRTRVVAFCAAVAFHLTNAVAFNIGVFPWLAISATALFLSPSWPRRIIGFFRPVRSVPAATDWKLPSPPKRATVLSFVAIYVAIQVLVPLRHFMSAGGMEWTFAEHRFSWRMMLVSRRAQTYFYVTDPNIGRTSPANKRQFLYPGQIAVMAYHPDMALQFAHYLAAVMPRRGPQPLTVETRMFISINGRKPELLIDPNVDLAAEPRTLTRPHWLLSIHEPLPPPGEGYSLDTFTKTSEGN